MTPTHPDLDPERVEQARRELGFAKRATPEPKPAVPPWRVRLQRSSRRALRPVYSRMADGIAERMFVENPVTHDVARLEAALTRVEAELELLRGQVAAQQRLLEQLEAGRGDAPAAR